MIIQFADNYTTITGRWRTTANWHSDVWMTLNRAWRFLIHPPHLCGSLTTSEATGGITHCKKPWQALPASPGRLVGYSNKYCCFVCCYSNCSKHRESDVMMGICACSSQLWSFLLPSQGRCRSKSPINKGLSETLNQADCGSSRLNEPNIQMGPKFVQ